MKTLLAALSSVLLLGACGRVDEVSGTRVGELRNFSPLVVSGDELQQIDQICQALTAKAQGLSAINTQRYRFEVTQKECALDSGLSGIPPVSVEVSVRSDPSGLSFVRTDTGADFILKDVVTATSDPMRELCTRTPASVADAAPVLTSPKKLANGNVLYFTTTGISTADCLPAVNERCLLLETAVPQSSGQFKVLTKEWMKFQLDPVLASYGFYTERKVLSMALCGLDQTSQLKAVLR